MRIGIDFDNTIVCYDEIFCDLARQWQLVPADFQGTKSQLRDVIFTLADGEKTWQRLQGKVYGEFMQSAKIFSGVKDFIESCNAHETIELFIVSHKTEFGHFDDNRVNLRDAALRWLTAQDFFKKNAAFIPEENVFFEATREDKIARIKALQCTHFIDDLIEVLDSPLFPTNVKRILFQPLASAQRDGSVMHYSNWADIKNAIFSVG